MILSEKLTDRKKEMQKLGLDNDWWEIPAMIAGAVLLLGSAVVLYVRRKNK